MNIIRAILFGVFIFAAICKGQDDTAAFRYRAGKGIPVGTVLHYVKTNIGGTHPEYVSQFIASAAAMESFKFHPQNPPAGFVIAKMDWQTFSAKSLTSWQIFSKDERKLFGTIIFDGKKRQAEVSIPAVKNETESFVIKQFPVHLYNFDFGSLNFAFPYLVKPKTDFVIGVADPTFQDKGALVEYKGEVTISYQAGEKRNNVSTRKYRVDGAGLKDRGGFIWISKKHGWVEDMEIALPDNPEWTSFKFKLLRVEKMNRVEWNNFMETQF